MSTRNPVMAGAGSSPFTARRKFSCYAHAQVERRGSPITSTRPPLSSSPNPPRTPPLAPAGASSPPISRNPWHRISDEDYGMDIGVIAQRKEEEKRLQAQRTRHTQDEATRKERIILDDFTRRRLELERMGASENFLTRRRIAAALEQARSDGYQEQQAYFRERQERLRRLDEAATNVQRFLDTFHDHIKSYASAAREDAAADWHTVTRFRPLEQRLATIAQEVASLAAEVHLTTATLRYTADWWRWRVASLEQRLDASLRFESDLKDSTSGLSAQLTVAVSSFEDQCGGLAKLLLDPRFFNERMFLRSDAVGQSAAAIHRTWPFFDHSSKATAPEAHNYRVLNRIQQTQLRLPEVSYRNLGVILDDSLSGLHASVSSFRSEWAYLGQLRGMSRKPKISSELDSKRRDMDIGATDLWTALPELFPNGLAMCNPFLSSVFGYQVYTLLTPFTNYFASEVRTRGVMRYECFNKRFINLLGRMTGLNRAIITDFRALESLLMLKLLGPEEYHTPSAWLDKKTNEYRLRSALKEVSRHLATSSSQASVDHALSRIHSLRMPFGSSENPIPIEYVISVRKQHQVYEALRKETILGFDMVAESNHGLTTSIYWLFATTKKVYVVENASHNPVCQLLADANIIKVVFDLPMCNTVMHTLDVDPQSMLSLPEYMVRNSGRRGGDRYSGHVPSFAKLPRKTAECSSRWVPAGARQLRSLPANSTRNMLRNLALQPIYSLIWFMTVFPDIVDEMNFFKMDRTGLKERLLKEAERLDKIFDTTLQARPTLGPVVWDNSPFAGARKFPLWAARTALSKDFEYVNLKQFVESEAHRILRDMSSKTSFTALYGESEFVSARTQNALIAYLLFCRYSQSLQSVADLLGIREPAKEIMWIASVLQLGMSETQRRELNDSQSSTSIFTGLFSGFALWKDDTVISSTSSPFPNSTGLKKRGRSYLGAPGQNRWSRLRLQSSLRPQKRHTGKVLVPTPRLASIHMSNISPTFDSWKFRLCTSRQDRRRKGRLGSVRQNAGTTQTHKPVHSGCDQTFGNAKDEEIRGNRSAGQGEHEFWPMNPGPGSGSPKIHSTSHNR